MRPRAGEDQSVRSLLVRLLNEMQPEIQARRVQLELDLDDVQLEPAGLAKALPAVNSNPHVIRAIRGLLADAIESASFDGELSVTLIDADNSWELELATSEYRQRCNSSEPVGESRNRLVGGTRGRNFAISNQAANECGGQIQIMECPQGGSARILVMPKGQRPRET